MHGINVVCLIVNTILERAQILTISHGLFSRIPTMRVYLQTIASLVFV